MPEYIQHRLTVAGADQRLFTDTATKLIYETTRGAPRLINILCDTALMYGFATEVPEISRELVQAVLEDKRKFGVFQGRLSPSRAPQEPSRFFNWSAAVPAAPDDH